MITKNTKKYPRAKNMYAEIYLYGLCSLMIVTYFGTIYLLHCCFGKKKDETDESSEAKSTDRSHQKDMSHKRENELFKRIQRRLNQD